MTAVENNPFITIPRVAYYLVLSSLGLVAYTVIVINISHLQIDLAIVLIVFLFYMVVLCLPLLYLGRQAGWFHPLIFTVLWWGIVREFLPLTINFANGLTNTQTISTLDPNFVLIKSTMLTILGYLALYLGYGLASCYTFHIPRVQFPKPRFLRIKLLVVAVCSGIAFVVLLRIGGGLNGLLLQRGVRSDVTILSQVGGHWHYLVGLLSTACIVWFGLASDLWRKPIFWIILASALIMQFIVRGSRSTILIPIIIVTSIYIVRVGYLPLRRIALLGIVALMLVGILGNFRRATRGQTSVTTVSFDYGVVGGISAGLDTLTEHATRLNGLYGIVGQVPHSVELLHGESYISLLVIPIPRAIWPDKPQAGGRLTSIYIFDNPQSGIPPGNIGEAYWNFHIPGVIVVMFFYGIVLKWLGLFYLRNAQLGWVQMLYITTLFFLQPNSVVAYRWGQIIVSVAILLFFFLGIPTIRWSSPKNDHLRVDCGQGYLPT